MLLKPGVDISKLCRQIRRKLGVLEELHQTYKEELIITCSGAGDHLPNSLHYADQAIDIRQMKNHTIIIRKEIQEICGDDFDVVEGRGYIHIEYDPKTQ